LVCGQSADVQLEVTVGKRGGQESNYPPDTKIYQLKLAELATGPTHQRSDVGKKETPTWTIDGLGKMGPQPNKGGGIQESRKSSD